MGRHRCPVGYALALWSMSSLCFLAAAASLIGWLTPAALWPALVMVGSTAVDSCCDSGMLMKAGF